MTKTIKSVRQGRLTTTEKFWVGAFCFVLTSAGGFAIYVMTKFVMMVLNV